ncbi:MAG: CoA pyrophosphatase [Gammaproteobacteria bacterium]|nr:CoA pyrophosphatase [Gammaproteobacteria bacterium]
MEITRYSGEHLIPGLKDRLTGRLPGEEAQFRMAPEGRARHSSVADAGERQSAVLIFLFPRGGEWRCVLMKRPCYDGVHSGQIAIPGGRLESGESHLQAALREFEEEIGVPVERSHLLGGLSSLFIPPSNYLVHPFVAYSRVTPVYAPDPMEVEQIIELPVSTLLSRSTVRRGRVHLSNGEWIESPYFDVEGHVVWGATAMILSEFKEILIGLR